MKSAFLVSFMAAIACTFPSLADPVAVLSPPGPSDQVGDLVGEIRYATLDLMDRAGLKEGRIAGEPWSDSYWPYYQGLLALRYSDPDFPASPDWRINSRYLLRTLGKKSAWMLSPAEKYDLLVGDPSFTLTRKMLSLGEALHHGPGTPAEWMGLCHGWAPASFLEARPRHAVVATSADGATPIYFSPSDIKGLATLLWARGSYPMRFIGLRCNSRAPAPARRGRPSPGCLDTNPATWHLAVVHQVGLRSRSLIMDIDSRSAVWNHPLLGYSYEYFHPVSGLPTTSLVAAAISRAEYRSDPYRAYRSTKTSWIVGIRMWVSYRVEDFPTPLPDDSESRDKTATLELRYDLELDAQGVIVGGEWMSPIHPDFLWMPEDGARSRSIVDSQVNPEDGKNWDGSTPLPVRWRSLARRASSAGQPLGAIVARLIALSNRS